MKEHFAEFLEAQHVDSDTIQQAARYYLAERTDDPSDEEMKQQLERGGANRQTIDAALQQLKDDNLLIDRMCLEILSAAWEEPGEQQKVRNAMAEAKSKLPIIEIGILAMVAMYGMYLLATGGIAQSETTTERRADGSYTEIARTAYHAPSGPLGMLVKMVSPLEKKLPSE